MQPVPRIFVSATSRDLRTARGLVSEGLRRMECLPIVQDDFPPDYKSVRDMLRTKISTCNAVVHLAGFYYGAEPQPVLPGPDRRSFTQMEYEIAMELKLPCYVFLCGQNFPFDKHDPEPEDKQQLQIAHRDRLLKRDELFYEFASPEELANRTRELQLSVEGLRKELAKERARRRLAMGAAVAALVVAVGGGIWMHGRQEKAEAVNVQQSSEIASLKAQLEGPWVIVTKVNAAMEIVSKESKATPAEMKKVAIGMVAAEVGKTPEQIQAAIDSTTQLTEKLIAAARAEAAGDASKRAESRALEIETLAKLGASHEASGRYKEALEAYTQRLALIDQKEQPEEWLDALVAVADSEIDLGKQKEGGARLQEGVEFGEKNPKLGLGHASTILATNRLATYLQYSANDLPAAEKFMRGVLKRREAKLGADHAETLTAMATLSDILASEKKFDAAGPLALKAWNTAERVFGKEDKVTVKIMERAASVLEEQGDLQEAISIQRRVVAFRTKSYGADSARVESANLVLAGMLRDDGKIKEAEKIVLDIYEAREKSLGAEHPDTVTVMSTYALILSQKKDYAGAEKIFRRKLAIEERILGPDHPKTIETRSNISTQRWNQDDLPGAEKTAREVLAAREKVLGANHESTIIDAWTVAALLKAQDKFPESEKFYRRVLAARETKPGKNSPEYAAASADIAKLYLKMGRPADGIPYAETAVKIAKETLREKDEDRVTYEELLADLKEPAAPKDTPAPEKTAKAEKAPPSLEDYADFRKGVNEKIKAEGWKVVTKELPDAAKGRENSVTGYLDGKTLRKVMKVDSTDDKNGTWTYYYWSQGWLTSVVRIREGSAVPIDGVAKATDTYNFFNGKLVGWRRTQDDKEKVEDPASANFATIGKRVSTEADEAAAPILKQIAE